MPVFEYHCTKCNNKYEVFHKSSVNQEEVLCPKCNSAASKKLFSTFSASMGSNSISDSDSCATGNCDTSFSDGCANGMCGLN